MIAHEVAFMFAQDPQLYVMSKQFDSSAARDMQSVQKTASCDIRNYTRTPPSSDNAVSCRNLSITIVVVEALRKSNERSLRTCLIKWFEALRFDATSTTAVGS